MDQLRAIFTKRPYHPGSLLIRCANPVSFVKIAPASHVITVDGEYGIEAHSHFGVRRARLTTLLKGLDVVTVKNYEVQNAEEGLRWGRESAERKDKYDFKGALALGLAPGRDWQDETDWFCFEHFANIMAKAGRKPFANNAHITAYMLLSLTQRINSPNE